MIFLFIDFELSSQANLKMVGTPNYVNHPSTKIACFSYWLTKNPRNNPTIKTVTSDGIADFLSSLPPWDNITFVAHNYYFEFFVMERFFGVSHFRFIDTMSLCALNGISLALDLAAKDIGIQGKSDNAVIYKLNNSKKPCNYDDLSDKEKSELKIYNEQDLNITIQIYRRFAHTMSATESLINFITFRANVNGIKVDEELINKSVKLLDRFKEEATERAKELYPTLHSLGQRDVINKIIGSSSGAEDEYLKLIPTLIGKEKELAELYVEANKKGAKKFKLAQPLIYDGCIHGNLIYHGSTTGRFTSKGLQVHNFKSSSPEKQSKAINIIMNDKPLQYREIPDVVGAAVRGIIIPEQGYHLLIADYKTIEPRILAWLTNETDKMQDFRTNAPIYEKMAAMIYNIPIEKVTQDQRKMGKATELGCGYGMGVVRFAENNEIVKKGATKKFNIQAEKSNFYKINYQKYEEKSLNTLISGMASFINLFDADEAYLKNFMTLTKEQKLLELDRILLPKYIDELEEALEGYFFAYECCQTFRKARPKVVRMWDILNETAKNAYCCPETPFKCSHVTFRYQNKNLYIELPSGRNLIYPKFHVKNDTCYATLRDEGKTSVCKLWGGDFINHICQGISRDLLTNAMIELDTDPRYKLLFTVHDELVYTAKEFCYSEEDFISFLKDTTPEWAKEIPIAYTWGVYDRYCKG